MLDRGLITDISESRTTLVDFGTGNGVLIAEIANHLAGRLGLRRVRLLLVDLSDSILAHAARHCTGRLRVPHEVSLLAGHLEDVDPEALREAARGDVAFVNLAACLHHVPRWMNVEVPRHLAQVSPLCILSELEGNHDLPALCSPELVASVARFYGPLI